MPFAFKDYDRVPQTGDEDYNHDDPMMRAAATEQRTRDMFVSVCAVLTYHAP